MSKIGPDLMEVEDDDWDDDEDEELDCFHCGGEGYVDCPNPMECTRRHTPDGACPCGSCGGSGLAEDMTIW